MSVALISFGFCSDWRLLTWLVESYLRPGVIRGSLRFTNCAQTGARPSADRVTGWCSLDFKDIFNDFAMGCATVNLK